MATLYEMSQDFSELFDRYECIADYDFPSDGNGGFTDDDGNPVDPAKERAEMQQAWFDTLDGMETELISKAEAVAVFMKNVLADIDAMKSEKKTLEARINAKENAVRSMEKYLTECLLKAHLLKIDTPKAKITVKEKGGVSTVITDLAKFAEWAKANAPRLIRTKVEEAPDKTAIKNEINAGNSIPYVQLVTSPSITIK